MAKEKPLHSPYVVSCPHCGVWVGEMCEYLTGPKTGEPMLAIHTLRNAMAARWWAQRIDEVAWTQLAGTPMGD